MTTHRTSQTRSHAVLLLQVFALTVMVIPSDAVIRAIGAQGYAAGLIGMFVFASFLVSIVLGMHNPLAHRHPVRAVLLALWLSVLISYVLMDRQTSTVAQVASADRMLMQLAIITGVALVAAECLNSLGEVRRVVRALSWGGAVCGLASALQYFISLDVTPYLRMLPGFSVNFDNPAIVGRASLNRVAGTATLPIELGVVAGMLLPLAIWLAMYDKERSFRRRWLPVMLTGLAVPTSVSRSAIIALVLAFGVFVVLMPPRQRVIAFCGAPIAVAGVFMTAHGIVGTLAEFFLGAKNDDSVRARTMDYPTAEAMVRQKPLFGHGGGTWLPQNLLNIFDNQYLKTAVELGLVGVVVLLAFFLVPCITALVARRRSDDPELRLLCAALAGAALAGLVCSATFDSLAFPMFSNLYALVIGFTGAAWRMAAAARRPATEPLHPRPSNQAGKTPVLATPIVQSAGG